MDNTESTQLKQTYQKSANKKWLTWLLIILVLLLLATAGYLWWQLKVCNDKDAQLTKDKQQLQAQLDKQKESSATSPASQATCNDTPSDSLKENIKAALDSKNTAAFASYFSNPVTFVIAASEKGGSETPDQAAVDMEYANTATGPWDFSLSKATLDHYDAGFYTNYFDANTYTGRAASGQVAAFDFDCNGKIKQAFLAASEDLL
jgi:cytoskeletal protein RodZ